MRKATFVAVVIVQSPVIFAAPQISEAFASRFQISPATSIGDATGATQMAFGPDGRLYVTSYQGEISSFNFNPTTGALTDKQPALASGFGMAFATHAVPGAPSQPYMYVSNSPNFEGIITRLSDSNGNGRWGEVGEVNVDIARGVPIGGHTLDQIQIRGTQLYVGIGARTANGRSGLFTGQFFTDEPSGPVASGGFSQGGDGFSYGETSYNGAIGTIRDLSQVPNITSAAQLRDGPNGTSGNLLAGRDAFLPGAPHATLPYTSTANDKLVVHSAGTRNPYGLAIDSSGELWFTNNYGRADANGDGTSTPHPLDALDDDLSNDVHDQLFRAVAGGDYGYDNTNFRGTPNFPAQTVRSTTFDNLNPSHPNYGTLHDPANPDGLGPSSSSNGLDFGTLDLTGLLATDSQEYALVSRWNDLVTEEAPGTDSIEFRDVVVVDPQSGFTRRLAEGFSNPIDIRADGHGGFLVADWGFPGTIYRITPRSTTSRWNSAESGSWSNAANWTGPVPDSVGAVASFTGAGNGADVNVDSPKVLGTLNFDDVQSYRLIGAGSITIDVAAGFGAINSISGQHELNVPLHLAKNTTINVNATSALVISVAMSAGNGVVITRAGAGTLALRSLRADGAVLNGGITRIIAGGADSLSRVRSLQIAGGAAPTATLDINNTAFIVDYSGSSPLADLRAQIVFARNGGAWNQDGITSSFAALNSSTTSIGIAEASDLGLTEFAGQPLDGDAIIFRYTRLGDANLDGITNINDFALLAAAFNTPGGWSRGDFNYDGMTNIGDFALLAANFGFTVPRTSIPEPVGAILFLGIGNRRCRRFRR